MPRVEPRSAPAPAGSAPTADDRLLVPGWLPTACLVLAALGLAVSGYLTYEHFTSSTTLACSDNGAINCLKVTTSAQSKFVGIPVALLGLCYFAAMIPLCLPVAWRDPRPSLRAARVAAATLGVGFICYLLYAELFVIRSICLWCTGVHVLTFALFVAVLFGTAALEPPPAARSNRS